VQDADVLAPPGDLLGDPPGSVGGGVVDDQDPRRGRQLGGGRLDQRLDVLGLVIGRQDHQPCRAVVEAVHPGDAIGLSGSVGAGSDGARRLPS
jgi:hypothetical protein